MCHTYFEEKLYILVLLDHVIDVDVDEHDLELFHNIDTTFIAFLIKKYVKIMCHTQFE